MTAASYTEDLTDLNTAEAATSWVELTGTIGSAYNAMGTPAGSDPDYPFIQGSYSVTQDCTKNAARGSLAYNNGAGTGGHGTDGAYFVWQNFMVASNIGTYAQGGFQIAVGSGLADFDASVGHTVVGESYVGNELQLTYGTQTGNYTEGLRATQAVTGATGIIVADHDDGTSGNLILRDVRGTFDATNIVTDTSTGSATSTAVRTITPVSAAPLGTYAGGKWFCAPGVSLIIANLAAGESQAYQLIDDLGDTQTPPNSITITQSNLVSGDGCSVYRLTGSGGTIETNRYAGDATNAQGDITIEVGTTIDTDNPTLPNSKVFIQSASGVFHRYRYDSYASTTWTLSPATTGLADAGGNTTTLIDIGSNFTTDEVEVGDLVRNTDDNVWSTVEGVDSATQLTVSNNGTTWASKNFSLNTLVEAYPNGANVFAAVLEREADATTENNQLILGSNFFVLAVVRSAGDIEPFEQEVEITGDTTIPTIRNTDSIYTP